MNITLKLGELILDVEVYISQGESGSWLQPSEEPSIEILNVHWNEIEISELIEELNATDFIYQKVSEKL